MEQWDVLISPEQGRHIKTPCRRSKWLHARIGLTIGLVRVPPNDGTLWSTVQSDPREESDTVFWHSSNPGLMGPATGASDKIERSIVSMMML